MAAAVRLQGLIPALLLAFLAGAFGLLAGADPAMAVAGALAVAFTLVVLASLYAGVILFILLTTLAEQPGLVGSDVTVSKLAGGVLVISWLASLATRKEVKVDFPSAHPAATLILVLLVSWLAVSQLWAQDPGVSTDAVFRLSLSAVLFLIVFTAVRTRAQVIGVVAAFVAAAALDAAYGLTVDTGGTARLSGASTESGELAAALVAGLALSIGLAATLRGKPLARSAVQGAAALCAIGIFLTGSRGGLIALVVALGAFIAVGTRWRGRLLALSVAVVLAGVGFFNFVASPELRERVYTVEDSGSGRVDLWKVAWRMVEDKPVSGIGIGNFRVSSARYALEPGSLDRDQYVFDEPKAVHNTYLEVWAETGLVGLTLLLVIVGFCLRSALEAAREFARQRDPPMEMVSRALFVAMAGYLAGAFFTSRLYEKDIWLILALGPTFLSVARARAGTASWEGARGWLRSSLRRARPNEKAVSPSSIES